MSNWPVQDAKARFSELLDACINDGPQIVTRRGTATAVVLTVTEWERLNMNASPSLKSVLLAPTAPQNLALPERRQSKRRKPVEF